MTDGIRPRPLRTIVLALTGLALAATIPLVHAADAPSAITGSETQMQPNAREQVPLQLPPGMSIAPSQPTMAPPASNGQLEGCPVRNLKPLELLV
jgi:hypothetical protein